MGRIKSLLVKRTAKQILIKHPEKFNEKFENDKMMLGNSMPCKSVRNKIAGYIARIQRMKIKAALEASQPKTVKEKVNGPLQAEIY